MPRRQDMRGILRLRGLTKLQSAMEYLMTYGWAILILAVIRVAFYELGAFNPITFAPKAQPGACEVQRTIAYTDLEGACNNAVPLYVPSFGTAGSVVSVESTYLITGPRTYLAWVYFPSFATSTNLNEPIIAGGGSSGQLDVFGVTAANNNNVWYLAGGDAPGTLYVDTSQDYNGGNVGGGPVPTGVWSQVGFTYNGTYITFYLNGQKAGVSYSQCCWDPGAGTLNSYSLGTVRFGANPVGATSYYGFDSFNAVMNGYISNVQIYNTSLAANDILSLYQHGIGAVPTDLQNLVGWWPLNGNTKDYAGNYNNGYSSNIFYTTAWYANYAYI